MNAHAPIFTLSPQQQRVVDWAANGRGSAFVEAVAGAGKTTTLIELLKATRGSVAFAAYNKKIADAQAQLTKVQADAAAQSQRMVIYDALLAAGSAEPPMRVMPATGMPSAVAR